MFLAQPLVDAELVANVAAFQHQELLIELLLQLSLPLEGQIRGAHDEDPLGQTPELELADEQAGHDGLAGPGVVCKQEPHAGELHEVFVDRLQLMWQRVHSRDGEAEVGVELVGDAEGVRLKAEPKEPFRRRHMRAPSRQ